LQQRVGVVTMSTPARCHFSGAWVRAATERVVHPTTRAWLDGLRDFAIDRRESAPRSVLSGDPAAWNAERSILGAALAARLSEVERYRTARLQRPAARDGLDPDPAIVVTTSAPGIAACAGLLTTAGDVALLVGDRIVAVTELEYRLWCIRHPDDGYLRHVNLWNWVKTRVPEQRRHEFSRHPLGPDEAYWLHRTGLAGAGPLDRRECHLWKWNGRHAALLQAFVAERRVGELGGPAVD
jgi:hypothetical protein